MKIRNYILLASVGLMAVACQDKKDVEPTPTGAEGDEVVFGASLDDSAESRTIYGDETSTGFLIKWLGDDQMIVASPQGCEGRNVANYGVNPEQLPTPTSQSDYAGTLVKKGATGVQWGTSETADFYSIYPQLTDKKKFGEDCEVTTTDGYTFNIKTQEEQTCLISDAATPSMTTADMYSCFMYAKKTGATRGQTVNLKYVPFATAIRFKLKVPSVAEGAQKLTYVIGDITLTAPNNCPISGKYTVDLSSVSSTNEYPTVSAVENETTNAIHMIARRSNQTLLQLQSGDEIELNIFIMLDSSKTYDISTGWSLSVLVNSKVQTLSLDGKTGGTGILTPGKIYRLPTLPELYSAEWDITKWLAYVPRNVYLSEISLPGSWNSLNSDFQTLATSTEAGSSETEDISKKTIDQQYALGCRAFHLDTRFRRIKATSTDFTNLGIANGGETAEPLGGGGKKVMTQRACPLFSEALGYITANVKSNEYMVVICTFAQNSYEGADWRQKISDACASNTAVYDASNISANTTINDVLGKVIVIVNCEGTPPTISGSKCLFVNAPLTLSESTFASGYPSQTLYKGSGASNLSLSYIHAQITSSYSYGINTGTGAPDHSNWWKGDDRGYAPALGQRQTIGNNILTFSQTNVGKTDYAHNSWLYLGLGGYTVEYTRDTSLSRWEYSNTSNAYNNVASNLNNWINGKVIAMDTNKAYYPVGIVLMNKVKESGTGWSSPETIKNIVFLNNKFHKAFDPDQEPWPDNTKIDDVPAGSVEDSGDAI